ncbi:MAG TPA: bifunctional transaldolase/phosoglucose isomerase [Thermoplasmata archaeon]|nr:bifunctional transaldolase/phosoglucose isomerase [Thermoplasmata archaeon]
MSAIEDLRAQGQSIWLDYIRRSLLTGGKLAELIRTEGVTGVTANPTIFEKAIAGSSDYDSAIAAEVRKRPEIPLPELYERLAVADVQQAADILRPVYDRTDGADGFVSLEVAPGLAHDTDGTIAEARRLWAEVARPNLLIKVPGTPEGVPAIERLLAQGINVNVTLLFSRGQYEAVAGAFLRGAAQAPNPQRVASVASFFVSRVDSKVDPLLDGLGAPATPLRGRIGIANCRMVYQRYRELFEGPSFEPLRSKGVRPQRLLWASTSTKDPRYRDTMYVEELIGPSTVDTIPPATLDAFRDHGAVRGPRVAQESEAAARDLSTLAAIGVDLDRITTALLDEGVQAFVASFDALESALEGKRSALLREGLPSLPWSLGPAGGSVDARLAEWQATDVPHRFWRKDPSFWPQSPPSDVASRMGWIHLPEAMLGEIEDLESFVRDVVATGFRHAVVLGMGGSSLAPDVFRRMFPPRPGHPELFVLDSTHPVAIRDLTRRLDLARTLFVVSSKSGTTIEPNSFYAYFADQLKGLTDSPGRKFVAITDPGTPLDRLATEHEFRRVFRATPDVGGRYSALTVFGLVPAALLGVDLRRLLERAFRQSEAGAFCVPAGQNPGFRLGAALGELGRAGRDKVTFLASEELDAFPDWAEQLIAESTGKSGRGLVPVVGEARIDASSYGPDRVFVTLESSRPTPDDSAPFLAALEKAGHPVLRFPISESFELGGEFFRWEVAVAMAGPVLGIDPYDQPDVELAKQLARQAMASRTSATGNDPDTAGVPASVAAPALDTWAADLGPNDYLGIHAYLPPSTAMTSALERFRSSLQTRFRRATTLGYGPRFLHSTGQLHKGGPPTGRFVQLLDEFREDVAVPGTDYTFGQLIRAQALGDFQALRQRGRRVLRIQLGVEPLAALTGITGGVHG